MRKREWWAVGAVAWLACAGTTAAQQTTGSEPVSDGGTEVTDSLDLTMRLLPEDATDAGTITRRIRLPREAREALDAADVPETASDAGRERGREGLETAAEARERGREFGRDVAEQARENRENAGRGNPPVSLPDLSELPPGDVPDGPSDVPPSLPELPELPDQVNGPAGQ